MNKADIWEQEIYLSLRKRERLAWMVAILALGIAILAVIAVLLLTPLKTIEPVVITVDKQTGNASLTSQIGSVTVSDEEAIAQALVHQYVRDRETYHNMDQKARVNRVFRFSRNRAAEDLRALYARENPHNPLERYGNATVIDVEILSIVLQQQDIAQLRLIKTARTGQSSPQLSRYVVTLKFGFDRSGSVPLKLRWENPTGFFVEEYRIDEEAAS